MERPTNRHHLLFNRETWTNDQAHANLRRMGFFIVNLLPEYHNVGEGALHEHVGPVPLIPDYMAKKLGKYARRVCEPNEPIKNISLAVNYLEGLSTRAREPIDGDLALLAAENLLLQEVFVLESLAHEKHLYVPQAHSLELFLGETT